MGSPSLQDGFFLSLSLSAKERGQGGEFRALPNRIVRQERNVFLFFLGAPRVLRFQRKSVKMNFDDPSEFTPHLFRFTNLLNQHVGVWCVCIFYGVTPIQG